jgi:hypothetical protein
MSNDNVQDTSNSEPVALTIDDAAEAILGNWEDADKEDQPSEDALEATEETTEETDVEDSDTEEGEEVEEEAEESGEDPVEEDSEEATEDDQEVEEVNLSDDTVVELVIDGETKQASLKDLKRLYGQEASLTRKSQETASQRKQADEQLQKADASLQAMLTRAQDRYKPYEEVDMLVASRQMNPDDFAALRAEAKAAESDLKFLTEEADSFYGELREKQAVQTRESAKQCIEVLQNEIPDWSNDLYNDIRKHAIQSGLPEEAVNQYTDPTVIKLLHKAMLFDRTKQVAKTKKLKAPLKVLRSKKAPPSKTDVKVSKQKAAQERLRNSASGGNDLDDIAAAIMSNWE